MRKLPLIAAIVIIAIGFNMIKNVKPPTVYEDINYQSFVIPISDSEKNERIIYLMDRLVKKELEIKNIISHLNDSTEKD